MTTKPLIEQIQSQIEAILKYSQGIDIDKPFNLSPLVREWWLNKQKYIKMMGDNLVYEMPAPVTFTLTDAEKAHYLEEFAEKVYESGETDLWQFLKQINFNEFFNNKTEKEYSVYNITIQSHSKVLKAFKHFISSEERCSRLQDIASTYIQKNCITGRLGVSVHPLDFLSASETTHHWRSCHALDGEYRAGNLSYLCDSSTIMVYLRSEEPAILPHFPNDIPWNAKKWRMWLHFSNDFAMLINGRQYPFEADGALAQVNELLRQAGLGRWDTWTTEFISSWTAPSSGKTFYFDKMLPVGRELKPLSQIVASPEDSNQGLLFNDVLYSSYYTPCYTYNLLDCSTNEHIWDYGYDDWVQSGENTKFVIGAPVPCPFCGEELLSYSGTMVCKTCYDRYHLYDSDPFFECEICGQGIPEEDMIELTISGIKVCPHCYDTETYQCACCGARDTSEYIHYRPDFNEFLCDECYEYKLQEKLKEDTHGD